MDSKFFEVMAKARKEKLLFIMFLRKKQEHYYFVKMLNRWFHCCPLSRSDSNQNQQYFIPFFLPKTFLMLSILF